MTVAETVTSDVTFCHFRAAIVKVFFLGKDQNVSHTFIRNKFPLRGIPAVSLFVSVILCLEVFFQLAPQKKKYYLDCWKHAAV